MVVQRITMFKITDDTAYPAVEAEYKKLQGVATKDSTPYILSVNGHPLLPDQRSQGFNFIARTSFATLDDMKYYDEECQAHKNLKTVVGPHAQGVMTVYWEE
ncbi:hypothetical protein MMC10_010776 [Thelotrema lepadinum]|nr:hypothetical protein [Thelotrema lepadinum]